VQEAVKKLTGKDPFKGINPDECVALGASIQGGKLAGDAGAGGILLLDVSPLSLSIETEGGVATRLIERNTTIPTNKKQTFSTAAHNQTAVDIVIVQGERQFAKDNKELGRFRLDGIPPAPRGIPQIEVAFDIDANGIVNVSAKDLGTGKEQKIVITASSNLSDDDIDRAVKEAEQYAEADRIRKEAVDAKNEAESLVNQTERMFTDLGEKVTEEDKAQLTAEMDKLKAVSDTMHHETMTENETATLKTACEEYMKVLGEFSQKLYANTAPEGAPEPGDFGPEHNHDPNVFDGDFTEN